METYSNLSNISFTLKYGTFSGGSRKKIFGAYIALDSLFLFGIVLGIVMASLEQINNPDSVCSFIGTILCVVLGLSVVPIVLFIFLYRNEKIRKEIKIWLEDAICLDAYIKAIDKQAGIITPLIKFQVDFYIDNIHYTRTSEEEKRSIIDYGRPRGYFSYMSKYIDKKVKILYSPKYNEVMILKNPVEESVG